MRHVLQHKRPGARRLDPPVATAGCRLRWSPPRSQSARWPSCRSRRSTALVGDEVTDGARRTYATPGRAPLQLGRGRHQTLGDQPVEGAASVDRDNPGYGYASIGHYHLVAFPDALEIIA